MAWTDFKYSRKVWGHSLICTDTPLLPGQVSLLFGVFPKSSCCFSPCCCPVGWLHPSSLHSSAAVSAPVRAWSATTLLSLVEMDPFLNNNVNPSWTFVALRFLSTSCCKAQIKIGFRPLAFSRLTSSGFYCLTEKKKFKLNRPDRILITWNTNVLVSIRRLVFSALKELKAQLAVVTVSNVFQGRISHHLIYLFSFRSVV